jgi:hypothetical protein
MAMRDIISALPLSEVVCKALGLDPGEVHRVIVDINAEFPVAVYVEMFGTDKLLEVDWAAGLEGAEIRTVDK